MPAATEFVVKIPLRALFPEMYIKEGGKGIFVSNESGFSMTFKVGSKYCIVHSAANTASTSAFSSIRNFRITYREAYPTPE